MLGTLIDDRAQAPQRSSKLISMMLITALIYMTIGYNSRNVELAFYWYLAIVLGYNCALLIVAKDRRMTLTVGITFYAIVVMTLHYTNPILSLDRLPIVSFLAAINLPTIVHSNISDWALPTLSERVKAISMATIIAWLGLIVGWLLPTYTAII